MLGHTVAQAAPPAAMGLNLNVLRTLQPTETGSVRPLCGHPPQTDDAAYSGFSR
jgi:hypothetical protein